jgi:hypothetical protein
MGRELDIYLDTVFGTQTGFAYAATKRTNGDFTQDFFYLPNQREELRSRILTTFNEGESYICPSLFAEPSGKKDHCLGSQVAWVDFDATFPYDNWPKQIPLPSLVVQTSSQRNVHAYWKFDTLLSAKEIEEVNRRLAYFFGADVSGWDANQLLRPPETKNHKKNTAVKLLTTGPETGQFQKVADFIGLPSPPSIPKNIEALHIPAIEEALANITWPANLKVLFENGLPEGRRHQGMFALAAGLAELNVAPQFILSVLLHSDNNAFHKFDTRPDQRTRIVELVTRAVLKVKQKQAQQKEAPIWLPNTITQLLTAEYKMEWILAPFIHKTTCAILSGPPGVGKSLMSLSLAQCLVIGGDFLGVPVTRKLKIGFISMEMDGYELHEVLIRQVTQYSQENLQLLDENLLILPFGEPKFYNDKETERLLFQFVGDNHLDGIFVDSLSSTSPGDLSSEKETKFIFELDSRIRSRFGCFTWYIHHNRKAQADNKKPNKLADLHGSVHIQSKPNTVITLWPFDQKGSRIAFKPLKIRSANQPDEIVVSRNEYLHYYINNSPGPTGVSVVGTQQETPPEQPEPEVNNAIGSDSEDPPGDGDGSVGPTTSAF